MKKKRNFGDPREMLAGLTAVPKFFNCGKSQNSHGINFDYMKLNKPVLHGDLLQKLEQFVKNAQIKIK